MSSSNTALVVASTRKFAETVVRDEGVQRAAAGALVAIGVAVVKFAFFDTTDG